MRRIPRVKTMILLTGIIAIMIFPVRGHADESTENTMGFSVESVPSQNQVDKTKSYFYLIVEPDTKQTIQVKVKNLTEEPIIIQPTIHDAVSSSVGAIDYADPKPKLDKSLKDPITSLVKMKDEAHELTLSANEEKTIDYEITPPTTSFPGVKLGSLRFVRKVDESEKVKNGVTPEYARVIAVMLTEDEEPFNEGAELHLKTVRLNLANGRKIIAANIQNDQPKVLQELSIKGQVTRKGEKEIIAKHEMEGCSVAPNSNFNFEIPLGLERFASGTYLFTGEAKGDGRTWKWEKEFTVDRAQAEQVNDEAVYQVRVPEWVPWAAACLIVTLLGIMGYLIYRQKQWNERK